MSTVMGTMRKMEDSPMDEKMSVAARSASNGHSSAELRGGCCSSLARKKTLVKRRRRSECRPNNGHFRKRMNTRRQEEDSTENANGDVPMDLSKRTGDEGAVRAQVRENDHSRGAEQETEEQPLNLSRNTRRAALRCDSCPNVAAPRGPANSSMSTSASPELLQKRVRLEEMVSYIRRFSVVDHGRHKNADCMAATGGASDSNHGEMDHEAEETRNVFGAVKRSRSCSSLLDTAPAFGRRRKGAAAQQRSCAPHKKRPRTEDATPGDAYDVDGGYVSYPVLRQQLLGVDCRRVGLLQSVASQNYTKDEGEYVEEEEEEEVGEDSSERENEDNEDGGALLHHQMRLLSTAVADPTQRFPWSAYAYYANLFQELQGSLASGAAAATLPLSLALPLAIPTATESHGESPLSSEGVLTKAAMPTSPGANAEGGAANAMFRKRAPRALTGKHVKHGTGASPATLLTLRQKIEQKRKQQAASPAHLRMDRKAAETGRMHKAMKGAPTSLLGKKKKAVS